MKSYVQTQTAHQTRLLAARARVPRCLVLAARKTERPDTPEPAKKKVTAIPARGYFSIADTKAEVYSKAGDKFDPKKKPGRYEPEFIWNTNWQESLEIQESLEKQVKEAKEKQADAAPGSGFLNFSRLSQLDDPNVDLSAALKPKPKPAQQTSADSNSSGALNFKTRLEGKKLERLARGNKKTLLIIEQPGEDSAAAAVEQAARDDYEKLKKEFLIWSVGLTAVGFIATYTSYTPDIAFSYLLGAVGGIAYLRLLSRSIDGVGAQTLGQGLSAAAGQPRFLIPVILALTYNRWNQLYADQFGVELQLLPMLVGFFTYKIAVVFRQGLQLLDEITGKSD